MRVAFLVDVLLIGCYILMFVVWFCCLIVGFILSVVSPFDITIASVSVIVIDIVIARAIDIVSDTVIVSVIGIDIVNVSMTSTVTIAFI